jgi:hypothetical protein
MCIIYCQMKQLIIGCRFYLSTMEMRKEKSAKSHGYHVTAAAQLSDNLDQSEHKELLLPSLLTYIHVQLLVN